MSFACDTLHLLLTVPRDPRFNYGLSPEEIPFYWEGMCALSEHTKIWPLPTESLRHGNKLTYVKHLKEIAEEVTETKYPNIFAVSDPQSPTIDISQKMTLSRTYGSPRHTFTIRANAPYKNRIKEELAITNELYGYFGDWIKPQWFAVPTIKSTKRGELRAFFVGGHLVYVLHIKKDKTGVTAKEATLINPLLPSK